MPVVVITGASDGIGRELALKYSKRQSTSIALIGRSVDKLRQVSEQCIKNGSDTLCFPIDVSSESSCQSMINEVVRRWNHIDILVLCAGISYHNTFQASNLDAFRKMMQGLFDSLRYEVPEVHITLIMPSSVATNMREHSEELGSTNVVFNDEGKRLPIEQCIDVIVSAADARKEKVILPFSNKLATMLKPWVPKLVYHIVKKRAWGEQTHPPNHLSPKL